MLWRERRTGAPSGVRYDAAEVVRTSYPRLLMQARRLTGSAADAEDLVQEAFVETLSRYPEFTGLELPMGYLTTVLYRSFFRRRRVPMKEIPLDLSEPIERGEPDLDAPVMVDQVLASLGPKQRACLLLRYVHDLNDEEIAAALGIRASTVRSQIARGLANAKPEAIDETG